MILPIKNNLVLASPLIGRFLIGGMFLSAGIQKIFGFTETVGFISSVDLPAPAIVALITIVIEIVGGLSLILGWKVKWGAGVLIVFTALATIVFHFDFTNQMQTILFTKNLAIIGGLFLIVGFGAGAVSLDNRQLNSSATPLL